MIDTIETIMGSVVQHGHQNNRIYVMHLNTQNTQRLIAELDGLAEEKGYGKIFAKIPAASWGAFKMAGYITEACVPGFYKGTHDGLFIAKFFSEHRQKAKPPIQFDCQERISQGAGPANTPVTPVRPCGPADAETLAGIYRRVFESYAFPIHRPEYLKDIMKKNAFYFCSILNHEVSAVAAMEIDSENANCEMTDFATLPEYRGRGLARRLLSRLDDEARGRSVKTAYTIARADSTGMNRVFQAGGYRYAGRLIKNTQIGGRIRSMVVWYKPL